MTRDCRGFERRMADKNDIKIIVKESSIHGLGVFARQDIAAGETLERCAYIVIDDDDLQEVNRLNDYLFTSPDDPNDYLVVMGCGMLYNHASPPNAKWEVDETDNRFLRFYADCDIGAGEGLFLKNVCDQGFGAEVFGIEPSERNCADMTAASVPCFKGTIEEFLEDTKMADKRFDIVTVMWTLENCRSCRVMVDAAWELLKPNGYIVVATGSRILVPFKKPLHYYISDYSGDTHPSRFSVNSLHNLLASSGFKESHVNRYIDTDYLVVAYQKTEKSAKFEVRKDDYLKVIDFFRRWHKETADYYGDT